MAAMCSIPGGPLSELPECRCTFSDIYETTQLANALHQIPHLNYLFQHVSSNFTYSTDYIQGVAFWTVCLMALFLFLMVHCLLYSVCMCRMVRKSKNTSWQKWHKKPKICLAILGVVAFLGIAVCAVGIWSDLEQNKTLVNFVDVFKSVNNLISTLDRDIKAVPVGRIDALLVDISAELNTLPNNATDIGQYKQDVATYLAVTESIQTDIIGVTDKLEKISLGELDTMMEQGVLYRLIATLLLFSLTAVVLFASIFYAIKPLTKCTGFVFLFIITFLFSIWWLLGTLAFTADIALADFCISPNPDEFIQSQINIDQQFKAESKYLLYCHGCTNPFTEILQLEGKIQEINRTLQDLQNFTAQHASNHPDLFRNTALLQIFILEAYLTVDKIVTTDLSCNQTSALYAKAIQDGCGLGLQHFTIETGCAVVLALILLVLTTLQCFNACKLVSFYSNKKRRDKQLLGLPDFSPMTFPSEVDATARVQSTRNPNFRPDPDSIGYRRSMNGALSDRGYPHDQHLGYIGPSGVNVYPNLPVGTYSGPVTRTTIQNDTYFSNAEYVYNTDLETDMSRASSMEDNLHTFFPEMASCILDNGPTRYTPDSIV